MNIKNSISWKTELCTLRLTQITNSHLKLYSLPLFNHPHVILKLYDLLSTVEHKRRYFETRLKAVCLPRVCVQQKQVIQVLNDMTLSNIENLSNTGRKGRSVAGYIVSITKTLNHNDQTDLMAQRNHEQRLTTEMD